MPPRTAVLQKCAAAVLSGNSSRVRFVPYARSAAAESHDRRCLSSASETVSLVEDAKKSSRKYSNTSTEEDGKEQSGNIEDRTLPPPLPEPKYSVHKRVLPSSLTAMSSPDGRKYLMEAFTNNTAESYWALTEQFINQTEPAFCGVTTLVMVLNAMCVDPQVRWRGGWRFYGSEEVLLDRCCLSAERVRRVGVTLDEFEMLGRCHGLSVELKRPEDQSFTVATFRENIKRIISDTTGQSIVVVSFSRAHLGQTGDGHFSPLAAYHEPTDQVLLLDVARFKYTPYWVSVQDLYDAMKEEDPVTRKSRGWFVLHPPKNHAGAVTHEARRPAELVPQLGDQNPCPVGKVKVAFCKANPERA